MLMRQKQARAAALTETLNKNLAERREVSALVQASQQLHGRNHDEA